MESGQSNVKNAFVQVHSSDLLQFDNLATLEVRGNGLQDNLVFEIDKPLPQVQNANFEAITLIAGEKLRSRRPKNRHPSETFDYAPNADRETYQVEVDVEEEVEIVPYDIYRTELKRSKQATFVGWKNLEILRIHQCQFDEIYWEMFDELTNLRHLSLEHNGIKVIPPFAFYGAMHIKTLSLAYNNILELHYRALAGLLELEHLNLSWNNLTKLSEFSFPPFPSLQMIDLQHNTVQFIFPMTFAVMNATKELMIGSDGTSMDLSISSGAFAAMDELQFLSLENVSTTQLTEKIFAGLKNVQRLQMSGSIKSIEYDAFSEMPKLRELILSRCEIMDISMDAFYGIRDLRTIDLSSNQLSNIPPGLFDLQRNLQEIYLQNNLLSEMPSGFFSHPSIKLIRLTENPLICSCEMSEFKQAITNMQRGKRASTPSNDKCLGAGKTFVSCERTNIAGDYPQWTYEFNNRLSPRCHGGPERVKGLNMYYALRQHLKCSIRESNKNLTQKLTTYQMEKQQRLEKKYSMTVKKMNQMENLNRKNDEIDERKSNLLPTGFGLMKLNRRKAFDEKIRKTKLHNEKLHRLQQQPTTNEISIGKFSEF